MVFCHTVWIISAKVGEKEIPDSRVVHIEHTVKQAYIYISIYIPFPTHLLTYLPIDIHLRWIMLMHSCTFHAKQPNKRKKDQAITSRKRCIKKNYQMCRSFWNLRGASHFPPGILCESPRQVDVVTFAAEKDSWLNALLVSVLRCVTAFLGRRTIWVWALKDLVKLDETWWKL